MHLFFTYILHADGKIYWCTALSKSTDLVNWTEPKLITPKDRSLNFCAPGNIVRHQGQWIMCFQTYPTPQGQKYGSNDARVWITRSIDLENWSQPEMLMVKGPDVPAEKMGRLIDPFLVRDKDQPGRWWCIFDDNAANISYSYDLKTWTYVNRIQSGENVCVILDKGQYLMFHSPKNGLGMKRSTDMTNWYDVGPTSLEDETGLITLGQKDWPWAKGRISAGFVMDLRNDPAIVRYLMFFHASGPEDEKVHFDTYSSLGIAWSNDLKTWNWPEKKK